MEEIVDAEEHRLGDEVEPAPVDQEVELVELERRVVAAVDADREIDADDRDFLGAGEQPRVGGAGRARRMVCGCRDNRSDRFSAPLTSAAEKRAFTLASVLGSSAAAQYLSVKPSQALVASQLSDFLIPHLLVGFGLLALVAHHADQAFVQDVIAEHRRRAVARDQRIGKQRHRRAAFVGDLVLEREQIMVVDRDGAGEDEALAVVVGQRHRMIDAERARAFLLSRPYRCRAAQRWCRPPAPSRIRRNRRPARRTARTARSAANSDRSFAILGQRQIVDAAAFEIDAAEAAACRWRSAGVRDHRFTAGGLRRGRGRIRHWRRRALPTGSVAAVGWAASGCGAGLGLRLFLLLELRRCRWRCICG